MSELENWIVWIVVDVVYVGMFIWRGLYLTAANYSIYLVLAALGYVPPDSSSQPTAEGAGGVKRDPGGGDGQDMMP